MGKGNRNDRQKIENQSANEERFLQKKKAQQSKTRSDKVIAAACIVIALIVVAILVINVFNETGVFMRIQPVMELEDVVVDQAMMTFFANNTISNWYTQYVNFIYENYYSFLLGYYKEISLDMSKDLTTQKITKNDVTYYSLIDAKYVGRTWYDYFSDVIISEVEWYVTYANAANEAKISLSEEDKQEIDELIEDLKSDLKKQGASIADAYGKGVTESDVRKCYELIYLANEFFEENKTDIEATLRGDEGYKKVEAFRDEHKEDYYFAKCLTLPISLSEKNFKTQEEYDSAVEAAKEAINKIAQAKNPEQFLQFVEEYLENPVETGSPKETTSETTKETEKETETKKETDTESEEETETADPLDKYTTTIKYETKDELGKWLFDETAPAWDNEVKVIEETGSETVTEKTTEKETESKGSSKKSETESESETETGKTNSSTTTKTYKTFKITVYMVRNHKGLDMEKTQSFGYFATTHKESMENFLKEFNALKTEDKTRDKFYDLADKYYEKYEENHVHTDDKDHVDYSFNYEKVDHVKKKCFTNSSGFGTSYSKIDKWLDDDARVKGDYTDKYIEVTTGTGDNKVTYYFALYFESHDTSYWYYDVFSDLTDELIEDWYDARVKDNPVDVDENAFADIQIVKYPSAS